MHLLRLEGQIRVASFQQGVVVEGDHTSVHRQPLAVLEVRRILLEHLRQVEGQIKLAAGEKEQ
jgi:hypothetical protein